MTVDLPLDIAASSYPCHCSPEVLLYCQMTAGGLIAPEVLAGCHVIVSGGLALQYLSGSLYSTSTVSTAYRTLLPALLVVLRN